MRVGTRINAILGASKWPGGAGNTPSRATEGAIFDGPPLYPIFATSEIDSDSPAATRAVRVIRRSRNGATAGVPAPAVAIAKNPHAVNVEGF